MSSRTTLLLVIWNVLLTTLVVIGLFRARSAPAPVAATPTEAPLPYVPDSTPHVDARIAYFIMDSVQQGFALVKQQSDRFRNEGRRLEQNLQREMDRAQQRYQELMAKDHTYSTKAEIQRDEEELQGLMTRIQEMQARSQQQLATLEVEMLNQIAREIEAFLEEYNRTAGHDYIFSVQDGGQIWTGNPALDITRQVVDGLNTRHAQRERKNDK
jgi:Skp family chaperone for outer membrane proteins